MSGTSRPRAVVVADWWWPNLVGGAEHCARDIAHALSRSYDVTVVVPSADPRRYRDGPVEVVAARKLFARRRHPDSLRRRRIELVTTWLNPWSAGGVVRAIETAAPDVTVVTNTSRTGPWVLRALRQRRYRTVRVFHDLSDTCWRRSRQKSGANCDHPCTPCRAKMALLRRATPAATQSVCVSHFVRDDLVRNRLITTESSGVGYPSKPPPDTVRRPAPVKPTDPLVLGYVGRIAPVKGIEYAIDVAAQFASERVGTLSLTVAGTGDPAYIEQLGRHAAERGLSVDFPGWMPIDRFCAGVDAVLIPSTWLEPFGRVAVEVGSWGLPILVSPVGGLLEAARLSGTLYGFADFTDTAGAVAELRRLLTDPTTDGPGAARETSETGHVSLVTATLRAVTTVAGRPPGDLAKAMSE